MRYSIIIQATLIALTAAAPAGDKIKLSDGSYLTISDDTDNTDKRNVVSKRSVEKIKLSDGSYLKISDIDPNDNTRRSDSAIEKLNQRGTGKDKDKITSCGPTSGWIPLQDHGSYNGVQFWGYNSTVTEFCNRASYDLNGNPIIVAAQKQASLTVRAQHDQEGLDENERGNRVGLKNDQRGHIEFEIHNKMTYGSYWVNATTCTEYLMQMANPTSSCYGKKNDDTKGGTWEFNTDDGKVTFHALPGGDTHDAEWYLSHDEF